MLLSDTLLTDYSDGEVEAVLAHKLAHHVNRDIWKTMAYEVGGVLCAFWVAARMLLAQTLGRDGVSDIAGLPLLALSVGGGLYCCRHRYQNYSRGTTSVSPTSTRWSW